jgi:menaquinone-dependent protoporphyrinogen oxidase
VVNKILVAYATKAGSTTEVAEYIGTVLRESGADVDVRPVKSVKDLSPYRAVILGSATRMAKMLPEVVNFAQKFHKDLDQKPAAYFTVCMTMKADTPENRATVTGYFKPLRDIHEPISLGLFAGKVDLSKLNPVFRFMFSHDKSGAITEGDWRDWDAIRAWAIGLLPSFSAT